MKRKKTGKIICIIIQLAFLIKRRKNGGMESMESNI